MTKRALSKAAKRTLILAVAGSLGAVFALVGFAHAAGLWINTTDSMPMGLWIETSPHRARIGDVVLLCLPDMPAVRLGKNRGYIAPGSCQTGLVPVLKPVAAGPGDVVDVSPAEFSVNGVAVRNSAQLMHDSRNRPMPAFPAGHYKVAAGELWLVSSHNPRSFDSRYFGPVPMSSVLATVRPLWITE